MDDVADAAGSPTPGAGLDLAAGAALQRPPVVVDATATVAEAARAMRADRASAALVGGDPMGIVTDSDLRRVVAEELPPDTAVAKVMSAPVRTLPADAPLYSALLLMLELHVKHVPIVGGDEIVGILADEDVVRQQARSPLLVLGQIRRLTALDDVTGLDYQSELAAAARTLQRQGLDELRVVQTLTQLNDALTGKLLRLAEAELGPPPCRYAWLELGSAGRSEQTLVGDQDNAIVYEVESPQADAYFGALADRVTSALVVAGFPECPGGHMATRLRRSVRDWEHVVLAWGDNPRGDAIVDSEVFLDLRAVHGDLSIAHLESVLLTVARRQAFLAQLARAAVLFEPPRRRFGRIVTDGGTLDLKAHGTAPIVLLARHYGIAADSRARTTIGRLADARKAGVLSADGVAVLTDAFRLLTRLRLRSQLAALTDGGVPSNRIALSALSSSERTRLRHYFSAVADMQTHVRTTYRIGD